MGGHNCYVLLGFKLFHSMVIYTPWALNVLFFVNHLSWSCTWKISMSVYITFSMQHFLKCHVSETYPWHIIVGGLKLLHNNFLRFSSFHNPLLFCLIVTVQHNNYLPAGSLIVICCTGLVHGRFFSYSNCIWQCKFAQNVTLFSLKCGHVSMVCLPCSCSLVNLWLILH